MVASQYKAGVLRIDCFGLQRVGFNIELDKALHDATNQDGLQTPQLREGAEVPDAAGKRKKETRLGGSGEGPSKRRKGSESEAVA